MSHFGSIIYSLRTKPYAWLLYWLWFVLALLGLRYESALHQFGDGTFVLLSIPIALSLICAPVVGLYYTTLRFGVQTPPFAEWFETDLVRILWFVGGPLALVVGLANAYEKWAAIPTAAAPPIVAFGALATASLFGKLQERLSDWAIGNRNPRDSLHPGQLVASVAGLFVLGLIAGIFLACSFAATVWWATLLREKHPIWSGLLPWVVGLFCAYSLCYTIFFVPGLNLFTWFASRKALERIHLDALLQLAVSSKAP